MHRTERKESLIRLTVDRNHGFTMSMLMTMIMTMMLVIMIKMVMMLIIMIMEVHTGHDFTGRW